MVSVSSGRPDGEAAELCEDEAGTGTGGIGGPRAQEAETGREVAETLHQQVPHRGALRLQTYRPAFQQPRQGNLTCLRRSQNLLELFFYLRKHRSRHRHSSHCTAAPKQFQCQQNHRQYLALTCTDFRELCRCQRTTVTISCKSAHRRSRNASRSFRKALHLTLYPTDLSIHFITLDLLVIKE